MQFDHLSQLPTDGVPVSPEEARVVNTLFKEKSTMEKIVDEVKDGLVVGAIFVLFSLPYVDNAIKSVSSAANDSLLVLLGIKLVCFMIVYYFIKNMYLMKK